MKGRKVWTMRREGLFNAQPVGTTHCGKGPNRFWFQCAVKSDRTDDRGFVVDSDDIQKCAEDCTEMSLSCELHAERIIQSVFKCMTPELQEGVTEIMCQVRTDTDGVTPFGEATMTWHPERKMSVGYS